MRILVIDDDPDVRMVMRINLTWEGHDVVEAGSGADGLRLLASEEPDIVVLDVMMPKLDGLEVLRQIRQSPETSDVPVVLVTARTAIEDQIEGLEAGADEYVTKPFSPAALAATLNEASSTAPSEREAGREARLARLVACTPRMSSY